MALLEDQNKPGDDDECKGYQAEHETKQAPNEAALPTSGEVDVGVLLVNRGHFRGVTGELSFLQLFISWNNSYNVILKVSKIMFSYTL